MGNYLIDHLRLLLICLIVFLLGAVILAIFHNLPIRMRKNWSGYLFRALLTITLLLGLLGAIAYYDRTQLSLLQKAACVLMDIPTLFLAVSKVPSDSGTLIHDIAKAMAPCFTLFGIYKVFENKGRSFLNSLFALFSRKIAIFGLNERSLALIKSLDNDIKPILFTDERLSSRQELELLKNDVILKKLDSFADDEALKQIARTVNDGRIREVFLLDEDGTDQDLAMKFIDAFCAQKSSHDLKLIVSLENKACADLLLKYFNSRAASGSYSSLAEHLELSIHSDSDLKALSMIDAVPFYQPIVDALEKKRVKTVGDIDNPHLLIAGFDEVGMAVLRYFLQTGILSPNGSKPRVTIVEKDDGIRKKIDTLLPMIKDVIDVAYIFKDVDDVTFVNDIDKSRPLTYVSLCYRQKDKCYQALDLIARHLKYHHDDELCIPVFIRADQQEDEGRNERHLNEAYLQGMERNDIFTIKEFAGSDIYSYGYLVEEPNEKAAVSFNYAYISTSSKHYADALKEWKKADLLQRQSKVAEALYASYIYRIGEDLNMVNRSMRNTLKRRNQQFAKAKNAAELWKTFRKDHKAISELVELEHVRYEGFLYSLGYVGTAKGVRNDELGLVNIDEKKKVFGPVHEYLLPIDKVKDKGASIARDMRNILLYLKEDPDNED